MLSSVPEGSVPEAARIRLLVGLGNPGAEYEGTRHNLGFEVVDRVAAALGLRFERQRRERGLGPVRARVALARGGSCAAPGTSCLLVKPWTYMNESGVAVAAYARHLRIAPESIFVILDDLNLPLGRIRIRPGGSPGGHNGLKSLRSCLGTEGFPRLRMGIAVSDLASSDMADPDFVLGGLSIEERTLLDPAIDRAVRACREWLMDRPLDVLMSEYNASPRAPDGSGAGTPPPSDSDRPRSS